MNILAASDIHGRHGFYLSILKAVVPSNAQAIVLAGDLLGYEFGFDKAEDAQRADALEIVRVLGTSPVPVFYIMKTMTWSIFTLGQDPCGRSPASGPSLERTISLDINSPCPSWAGSTKNLRSP